MGAVTQPLYPVEVFEGTETALFLFGAGFLGEQDARHGLDAGVVGTVVDCDQEKVREMRALYPGDWKFICGDAFYFGINAAGHLHKWDVVSVDPFTNLFARCLANLPLWCALAKRAVVLGTQPGIRIDCDFESGWAPAQVVSRSPIADWTVFTR